MAADAPAAPESLLYIIHVAAARDLAILVRSRIADCIPGIRVFLASKASEIPTGEDWLATIHDNLKGRDLFPSVADARTLVTAVDQVSAAARKSVKHHDSTFHRKGDHCGRAFVAAVPAGLQQRFNAPPPQDCAHFIAHVRADNVSFWVRIDPGGDALEIRVPEQMGSEPAPIRVQLKLRDETIIEGSPERLPSIASGGWVDQKYRLLAKRPLTITGIFSVTISIRDNVFEVFPW